MAYSIYDHFIANDAGDIVNNATVTVNAAGGGLAQIYVNRLGSPTMDYPSGQLPNPLTVTSGRITFYASALGRYTITAVTADGTVIFSDVVLPIENPATLDDVRTSVIVAISGSSNNLLSSNSGAYHMFTSDSAKTFNVRPDAVHALPAGYTITGENEGDNNLTIVPGSGVTIRAPFGGSLVVPSGGSFSLIRTGLNSFKLIGDSVAS